ncbi:MAG TPA: transketolase [Candidatus Paceibacterota bacterium]
MADLTDTEMQALENRARDIRITIIEMLAVAKSGHLAGPLGMTDIFTALYFHIMKHDPKNPDWAERDRLFLSNGHICPVRYATMAHAGYFPVEECMTLRKFGSRLQGHPERDMLPGIETTSGPLGSGISQAAGYAYAARMDGKTFRVFCATSDGEHEEGNTWEGVMFAAKYRLNNLTAIMDRNNIQIDGNTEDVMPLEPLADKYRAFNWHVIEVDGHNMRQFVAASDEAKSIKEKPTMILAHTTPSKGVPAIENDYRWHGAQPGNGPTDKVPAEKQKEEFLAAVRGS